MGIAALVAAAVWLGILTVLVLMLIRQVGLITVRLDRREPDAPVESGLPIGTEVGPAVEAVLPTGSDSTYVLVLSATCRPCREVAEGLSGLRTDDPVVALLTGRIELVAEMVALLPASAVVITDNRVNPALDELGTTIAPFAFQVENGTVVGKAAIQDYLDLERFVASTPTPVLAVHRSAS